MGNKSHKSKINIENYLNIKLNDNNNNNDINNINEIDNGINNINEVSEIKISKNRKINEPPPKIVVGIDLGTSGIGYAYGFYNNQNNTIFL